jgi:hypothetical protein
MDERGLGLEDARDLDMADATGSESDGVNWPQVAEQFLESRADRRASTLGDLKHRVANVLKDP